MLAFGLGAAVRVFHVARADFPLNDGGLFYAMVRDIQAANYRLPSFTSYNQMDIPFGYPPLGLYIAGLMDDVTPFDLLTVFRLLPLLYSLLTLVAMFLLARQFLTSRVAVAGAVIAFGLIPRSFIWLIMGGGVTRGLGLLLAMLALREIHLLYTRVDRRYLWTAVPLSGGTILAHLETGWFLAVSVAVLWLFLGRNRSGLASSLLLALGTLAVISPWVITLVARHDMDPFLAALSSGSSVFSGGGTTRFLLLALARMVWTSEAFFPLIGVLGVVGAVVSIRRGSYLLPAWWAAIILLDARAFHTYSSIPVAILAGQALAEVLIPFLLSGNHSDTAEDGTNGHGQAGRNGSGRLPESRGPRGHLGRFGLTPLPLIMGAVMLSASVVSATSTAPGFGEVGVLTTLGPDQRAAMDWIREHTPGEARFLVMPRGGWQTDKEAEWFPVFAGRTSVATVQGSEWIADRGFDTQVRAFDAAWDCGYKTVACLDQWIHEYGRPFEYLYIPAGVGVQCCSTLVESIERDSTYRLLYYGRGGSIYVRVSS